MRSRNLRQVLCFVRTKHGASRLARQLEKDGLETSAIHGDKTQGARMDALAAFKEGKLEVLVATDVAARGLDVDDLPLVVNYELPHVPEDYIHRIGRTGRAGATGEAISLVAPEEEKYLVEIERLLKKKITIEKFDGFDPRRRQRADGVAEARASHSPRAEGRETPRREPAAPRAEARSAAPRAPDPANRGPRNAATRTRNVQARAIAQPRELEREEAYARNPDQPLPSATAHASGHTRSALVHGHGGHGPKGKARPVPALLMKRKAKETESA